jgi:hypothetical protein
VPHKFVIEVESRPLGASDACFFLDGFSPGTADHTVGEKGRAKDQGWRFNVATLMHLVLRKAPSAGFSYFCPAVLLMVTAVSSSTRGLASSGIW